MILTLLKNRDMSIPLIMTIVFFIGYLAIILEHKISVNKSATALITAVLCWVLISMRYFPDVDLALVPLNEHLADISLQVRYRLYRNKR
jgi:hypothetical protein